MSTEENSLFRKSMLDGISSPEQLNEYIKITNPSLVAILLAIFIILVTGAVWIFTGNVHLTVDTLGIVAVSNTDNVQRVYCYDSIAKSKRFKVGMTVQISPDYASREEYGYLEGTVMTVGDKVVDENYLFSKFDNPNIFSPIFSSKENVVEIVLDLGKWSNEKGESIVLTEGSVCKVLAITGKRNMLDLMFNL